MATSKHALLWQLYTDTASEISESQQGEIDAWLDEQAATAVIYARDVATALRLLEQELTARGISMTRH
jgi:hypothetical protein